MTDVDLVSAAQTVTDETSQGVVPRRMTPTQAVGSAQALDMIRQALPDVGLTPEAVQRTALTLLKQTPKLAACEADTVVQGLVRGAALGLDPDPALGQMWLVPRRSKRGDTWADVATFQIGYRGLLELVTRSGAVSTVTTQAIHAADDFWAGYGSDGGLVHRPQWFSDRGDVIGYYAHILLTSGAEVFAIRSVVEIEAHRDLYAPRGKDGNVYGPWVDHFGAMAERTVFLAAAKWLPRSITKQMAQAVDHDVDPDAAGASDAPGPVGALEPGSEVAS